mmetsp:Transcript_31968/g.101941  ORF Transcript_31968/g.101941 Transcript_31968/m.101941 type:complete len:218 (-) Transcript_31968:585-1238(-)|eukprot:scaffold14376_cov108-Isochrysis_galbana.AAC.2
MRFGAARMINVSTSHAGEPVLRVAAAQGAGAPAGAPRPHARTAGLRLKRRPRQPVTSATPAHSTGSARPNNSITSAHPSAGLAPLPTRLLLPGLSRTTRLALEDPVAPALSPTSAPGDTGRCRSGSPAAPRRGCTPAPNSQPHLYPRPRAGASATRPASRMAAAGSVRAEMAAGLARAATPAAAANRRLRISSRIPAGVLLLLLRAAAFSDHRSKRR